jgi:3-dehydroquinate synthase
MPKMKAVTCTFKNAKTAFYFDATFQQLESLVEKNNSFVITDEHVFKAHRSKLKGLQVITIPAGEKYKVQATVDMVIQQLITAGADRNSFLIGLGGGVVTDITGYIASIYMRGIAFGFVPTTILAMVDAAIGGKNGIDVGWYKNMVGLIRQPRFILYDYTLLKTLPKAEWINGFAEIIKHACIKDAAMFALLEKNRLRYFQKDKSALHQLIKRNALLKAKIVMADETEQGDRKLLNFGHTFGHAIENLYELPHGHAVAIGMVRACDISQQLQQFKHISKVIALLEQYHLPTHAAYDREQVLRLMQSDKKKTASAINYILLQKIGKAVVQPISFEDIATFI